MPRQRKLNSAEKDEAKVMLQMKVNKKLLQQHLSSSTGKVVTLRDLTNVQAELNTGSSDNDLDILVTRLRQLEGSYNISVQYVNSLVYYSSTTACELTFLLHCVTYVRMHLNSITHFAYYNKEIQYVGAMCSL